QLADEPALRSFARLHEAARKIPRARVRRAGPAPEQHASSMYDQRGGRGHRIGVERPAAARAPRAPPAAVANDAQTPPTAEAEAGDDPHARAGVASALRTRLATSRSARAASRAGNAATNASPRSAASASSRSNGTLPRNGMPASRASSAPGRPGNMPAMFSTRPS